MKKVISLLMLVALVFTLGACSSKEKAKDKKDDTGKKVVEEKVKEPEGPEATAIFERQLELGGRKLTVVTKGDIITKITDYKYTLKEKCDPTLGYSSVDEERDLIKGFIDMVKDRKGVKATFSEDDTNLMSNIELNLSKAEEKSIMAVSDYSNFLENQGDKVDFRNQTLQDFEKCLEEWSWVRVE